MVFGNRPHVLLSLCVLVQPPPFLYSGQVVKGAPPPGATPQGRIEELFDNARRRGATDGVADDLRGVPGYHGASQGAGFAAFAGRARTLADIGDPAGSSHVGGVGAPPAAAPAAPQGPLAHVIAFYRNGVFTVDDGTGGVLVCSCPYIYNPTHTTSTHTSPGPARHIDDPANAPFLQSIQRGECPQELEPADRSVQVTVNMLRKDEDYAEPEKPRYTAFTGAGRKLTDDTAPSGTSSEASRPTAGGGSGGSSGGGGATWSGVDEGQPTTSLQLRLADGSRMVARFNLSHTIGDVRRCRRMVVVCIDRRSVCRYVSCCTCRFAHNTHVSPSPPPHTVLLLLRAPTCLLRTS